MAGDVRIEREGPIAWVVFDHEERRNAITADMWQRIPEVARELDEDEVRRMRDLLNDRLEQGGER